MEAAQNKTILYVRLPGLLAQSALSVRADKNARYPIIVSEGRLVRDACPRSVAAGVKVGASVVQARRLCPALLAVPLEEVDARTARRRFLDALAELSPIVEPDDMDAGYVDTTGSVLEIEKIALQLASISGMPPVLGLGFSRLAAHACAESHVQNLEDAGLQWLWPNDPAVMGRLQRLGLSTFGAVAAASEDALRLHFGKIAPLLHRRAQGVDLTPLRALYPPPFVDVVVDCGEAPVDNSQQLRQIVARASAKAAYQLQGLGVGRHLILDVQTERGKVWQEWAVPVPVEKAADIQRALWRMLGQARLPAPVTRLRVLIEDVSIPPAFAADLFGMQSDAVSLEAVRRRLSARFGLTTLKVLGQQPRTERDKRRAVVAEKAEAFQRLQPDSGQPLKDVIKYNVEASSSWKLTTQPCQENVNLPFELRAVIRH